MQPFTFCIACLSACACSGSELQLLAFHMHTPVICFLFFLLDSLVEIAASSVASTSTISSSNAQNVPFPSIVVPFASVAFSPSSSAALPSADLYSTITSSSSLPGPTSTPIEPQGGWVCGRGCIHKCECMV